MAFSAGTYNVCQLHLSPSTSLQPLLHLPSKDKSATFLIVLLGEASTNMPVLLDLPDELLCLIATFMRPSDVWNLKTTCKFLRNFITAYQDYIGRGTIQLRYSFLYSNMILVAHSDVVP
ncbi:hypothetical protein AOQ84DRAFT_368117 [Glonium stellatum]|uniref:F-box domain-containing protein n=1 Tax=Glonium stellatum TaxID=574774 RepID=A0A8E2ESF0_9PEZI|nr:hypothetical protein AOQ84DRAFT_368117 [Glonium stellatum]